MSLNRTQTYVMYKCEDWLRRNVQSTTYRHQYHADVECYICRNGGFVCLYTGFCRVCGTKVIEVIND